MQYYICMMCTCLLSTSSACFRPYLYLHFHIIYHIIRIYLLNVYVVYVSNEHI